MAALISKLLVCSLPCIQPPILVVHGPAPYCLSRAESDCENDLCPFYFLCGTHEVMFSLSHHGPVSHPDYGTVWNQKVLRAWCASLLPSRGDQCCGERRRKRERESERQATTRLFLSGGQLPWKQKGRAVPTSRPTVVVVAAAAAAAAHEQRSRRPGRRDAEL